jgi:D-amino peptidase
VTAFSTTPSPANWQNLWFNGTRVGETGINAALCGTWGCPVVLVTGDDAVCREARELLGGGLTTVSVKKGLGALSARLVPPARARQLIEDGARQALADPKAVAPYDPGKPCEIKVEYKTTGPPQKLRFQQGIDFLDDRMIVSRADDWWTAWKQFFFAG